MRFSLTLLVAATTAAHAQRPCDVPPAQHGPSRDLYCVELIPSPDFPNVSGRVELGYLPNPFTVATTVDGRLQYQPVARSPGSAISATTSC